jgi:hypothetical protein
MANDDPLIGRANSQQRFLPQNLNTWVQTIGIIGAAIWGIYAFHQQYYVIPSSAPVNITLDLQLKRSGVVKLGGKNSGNNQLLTIEMKVSATNPSSRTVYLLQSAWYVYGLRLKNEEGIEDKAFNADAKRFLNSKGAIMKRNMPPYNRLSWWPWDTFSQTSS